MLDIVGYEKLYGITEDGKVWSHRQNRFLKTQLNINGYLKIGLCKDGIQKRFFIHRLVARRFIPNLDSKLQVNHIDMNKLNNHVSNLEWCTNQENMNHRTSYEILTNKKRPIQSRKLSEQIVKEIRILRDNGISLTRISRIYGIDEGTIYFCVKRITYKDISD